MVQFWKQALYHEFQGLALGTTFKANGGRREKWVDRGLAVGHKMGEVFSIVLSNGNGSCGLSETKRRSQKMATAIYTIKCWDNSDICRETLKVVINQRDRP
jgi:hypothetical protein